MANPATVWYNCMQAKHTPNIDHWPKVGCRARFVPWGKGASLLAVIKKADGTWEAFMADRCPGS
eukprot:8459851-Prorocentrum_lima.AAC.1